MPTVITHAVVGLGLGKVVTARKMPALFWVLTAALPMLPDLDVVGFRLGIPYGSPFGHRGFTHSILFALVVSLAVAALTWRRLAVRWWDLWTFFFAITVAHGILDAFTNGGLGIEFLWPFDTTRYFFPWRPLQVSPIALANFFDEGGTGTLVSEFLWVWLPTAALVGIVLVIRAIRARIALTRSR